jgi:glutamate-1-semialdehyde 2,1-aminomutase
VPCGALGLSAEVERGMLDAEGADYVDTGGIGGTLAGNALSLAAMRATLSSVLTDDVWERTIPLAERWADGVRAASDFSVSQLGCRAEYRFGEARNGSEAHALSDPERERFLHLYALNRGVLITPFHNMALMAPTTTEADVDLHTEVFADAATLVG